jgi:tRNA-binding EMAP/Myf-like protein
MPAVHVCEIVQVDAHPNADRLNLVTISHPDGPKTLVSGKVTISVQVTSDDGTPKTEIDYVPRYVVGDHALYVPVGSRVPEYILRDGFWNEKKNCGGLGGENGDIVEPRPIRGIESAGLLLRVEPTSSVDEFSFSFSSMNPPDAGIIRVFANADNAAILEIAD